jgi:transposase
MSQSAVYRALGVEGHQHRSVRFQEGCVVIRMTMDPERLCCPGCGTSEVVRRGTETREYKAPPIAGRPVSVLVDVPRLECSACGTVRQANVAFADRSHRCTRSFVRYLIEMRQHMTVKDLAAHLGVSQWLVRNIEKEYLHRHFSRPKLRHVRRIAIDEISIGGGHRYLTVVLDLERGAVLFVGDGKGAEALDPFWKRLKASRAKVRAVAMDMSAAYILAVNGRLPQATLVFDHFHVVKLFNDKLSALRRELYREAKDQLHKNVLKGTRWLLLKNPENLEEERDESARLREALKLNQSLATAYYLKEDLRQLWSQPGKRAAGKFLTSWCRCAEASGIRMLQRFAHTLRSHRRGLLAWYDVPISTGPLEGTNNKIRTLQRQAYRFRDRDYFILKIYALHMTRYVLVG